MKHEFRELPVEGEVGQVSKTLIEGVKLRKQKLIPDDRGFLMEMMRPDWDEFEKFGQVYTTMCLPGCRKAFHYHRLQIDYFNCVSGLSKVVLYDNRPRSSTKGLINEFVIGPLNPIMIRIPNLVWHGFTAVGNEPALIVNCPTEMYNYEEPDEFRTKWNAFSYDWDDTNG
jgi:dTDP-4-dehydrorhamnose 3,5-epimerase